MKIINSNDSHLPAITDIYESAVLNGKGSFENVPPSLEEMAKRRAAIVDAGLPFLVAIIDAQVAGYAYAGQFRPRIAYKYTVEDSIYVHPSYRSRGVGEALLRQVMDICTQKGYRQMIAVIGDSENLGSVKVHEKLGFSHAGNLTNTGRKFGQWIDTVLMQIELGEGAHSAPSEEPELE